MLQALGGAALVPSSLALVLRATPRPRSRSRWPCGRHRSRRRCRGPDTRCTLVEAAGWRWVFVINLPVGIVTVMLGRRWLIESRDPTSQVPAPLGVALLIAGSVLLTLGLVRGEAEVDLADHARRDPRWLALLLAFLGHQARTAAPTIDLSLFAIRNFGWGNLARSRSELRSRPCSCRASCSSPTCGSGRS